MSLTNVAVFILLPEGEDNFAPGILCRNIHVYKKVSLKCLQISEKCPLLSGICVISLSAFSKVYSGRVVWPLALELLASRSFAYLETNVFEFCSKARDKKKSVSMYFST